MGRGTYWGLTAAPVAMWRWRKILAAARRKRIRSAAKKSRRRTIQMSYDGKKELNCGSEEESKDSGCHEEEEEIDSVNKDDDTSNDKESSFNGELK